MTDLTTLMTRATADIGGATDATIDNDVTRAQRARRKRLGASGLGGATAVVTLALGLPLIAGGAPASAVELVAYAGSQPDGFTLEEVPEGWNLSVSDDSSLLLSPQDEPLPLDSANGLVGVEDLIAISLVAEESLPSLASRTLPISDTTARAYDMLGASDAPSGVVGVFVPQGEGMYLSVQLPRELHWSDAEASQFIEGIDVDADALVTDG